MLKVSLFYYWIPAGAFPNPSPALRRIGNWVDGSVWWIPTHLLPYNLIHRMKEAGVDCNDVPLDPAAAEKMLAIVRRDMRKRAIAAAAAVQKAAERPNDPETTGKTDEEWEAGRPARVRVAARQARRLLADLESAASGFGLSGADLDLIGVETQIRVVQTVSTGRARAYHRATETVKRSRRGAVDGMVGPAERDQLPPGVLADYLRDNEEYEAAEELTEAFADD
jgi:hypothetical protein